MVKRLGVITMTISFRRIKDLIKRVKRKVIRTPMDFKAVQVENGNPIIDLSDLDLLKRADLELLIKLAQRVGDLVEEYEGKKVIKGPKRTVSPTRYEPPGYRKPPKSIESEIPEDFIDKDVRGILEEYAKIKGWTEDDIRKFFLSKDISPAGRVLMVTKNDIARGNEKLDSRIGIWNLPCQLSCPASTAFCREYCYAKKAEAMYKGVLPSRLRHYLSSLREDFVDEMIKAIKDSGARVIRIHESGDFYSTDYLLKWLEIAKNLPGVRFYAYTKALNFVSEATKILNERGEKWPGNFIIQGSVEPETKIRFRDKGEKVLRGTPLSKVRGYLQNPNIAGLSIILPFSHKIPFAEALKAVAEVISQGDDKIYEDIVNNTYPCPGSCGGGEGDVFEISPANCMFCFLTKEEREYFYRGKHNVAFYLH
jgi:hypothetical protein